MERNLANHGLDAIPISRFHHHANHAASAYYGLRKNWEEPHLVMTLDGGGDDACAHVYLAEKERSGCWPPRRPAIRWGISTRL